MTTSAPTPSAGDEWLLKVYHYIPNDAVAYLFIALMSALTLIIAAQALFKFGGSAYMSVIVLGGIIEVLGYGTRVLVTKDYKIDTLIVTSLFLLVAPILFAFVNYLVAGWLLHAVGKRVRVLACHVSPDHIAWLFLTSDVLCMLLQGAGGAMLADGIDESVANPIVLTGLAVQIVFLSAFVGVLYRLRFRPDFVFHSVESLRSLFVVLFLTTALIWLRTVYRLASFSSIAANSVSDPGYIPSSQWMFFVFDSTLMTLVMALYAIFPLNKYLQVGNDKAPWKAELHAGIAADKKADKPKSASLEGGVVERDGPVSSEAAAASPAPQPQETSAAAAATTASQPQSQGDKLALV